MNYTIEETVDKYEPMAEKIIETIVWGKSDMEKYTEMREEAERLINNDKAND